MVEEGLKNRENAEVLVAEGVLDFLNLFGKGLGFVKKLHGARGDLPIDGLDARLGAEVEQAEVEHRLGALADFLGVVEILEAAIHRESGLDFQDVGEEVRLAVRSGRGRNLDMAGFFNRTESLDDQNGVLGDDGTTTFADQDGMWDGLGVADLFHGVDDVAHIFVHRIVH